MDLRCGSDQSVCVHAQLTAQTHTKATHKACTDWLQLQLLLLSSHSYAQQNDIYTSYGVDDGLPQSSVRICQEAIANALKYAHATILYIQVFSSDERYKVSIGDNGSGFDISKVDAAIQNGIENMRFRAGDIGANFTIIAEPGKGTSIEVIKNIR